MSENHTKNPTVQAAPAVEGEVAEQIVTQINAEGDGQFSIPEELSLLPLRDTVVFPVLVSDPSTRHG